MDEARTGGDVFLKGGLPGSRVSEGHPSAVCRRPRGQGLPSPPQPGRWWPRMCRVAGPLSLPGTRRPDSVLLGLAWAWASRPAASAGRRALLRSRLALSPPASSWARRPAELPAGVARSPVSAGPAAALAQGELQRSLRRLDPPQGAAGVCGVRAQVRGGGARRLSCWGAAACPSPPPPALSPAAPGSWPHAWISRAPRAFPRPCGPMLAPFLPGLGRGPARSSRFCGSGRKCQHCLSP